MGCYSIFDSMLSEVTFPGFPGSPLGSPHWPLAGRHHGVALILPSQKH